MVLYDLKRTLMRDDNHLENLFEKLIKNRLSRPEWDELSNYFDHHSASGAVDRYFQEIWNTSHHFNAGIQSDLLLNKIYHKSGIVPPDGSVKTYQSIFGKIFRYAAVIVVAFGLSWMLNTQHGKQGSYSYAGYTGTNEVMVSYGSKSKIRLPDGSIVNLNSGSKLVSPAVYGKSYRQVDLEGEAYFNVKADASRPFYVNASEIIIKATGTAFNIKSYPGSNIIETILISGSLEISEKERVAEGRIMALKPMILKPNQEAIYIRNPEKFTVSELQEFNLKAETPKGSKLAILDKADIHSRIAWNDNKLVFNNEKFEDLIIKLERWFNVRITIISQELKKERFTGTFENETIEQVLEALKMAEFFEYTIVKNEIMIFKKHESINAKI
jgi:transmembrane sensor